SDTAPSAVHTLSLPDALPIFARSGSVSSMRHTKTPSSWRAKNQLKSAVRMLPRCRSPDGAPAYLTRTTNRVAQDPDVLDLDLDRSEEHTSELQSLAYLVCRLL